MFEMRHNVMMSCVSKNDLHVLCRHYSTSYSKSFNYYDDNLKLNASFLDKRVEQRTVEHVHFTQVHVYFSCQTWYLIQPYADFEQLVYTFYSKFWHWVGIK